MDYIWRNDFPGPSVGCFVVPSFPAPGTIDHQHHDERFGVYLERPLHQAAIEAITHNVHPVMQLTYRFIRELEKEVILRCEEVNHAQHAESPSHLQRETRNATLLHMAAHLIPEAAIVETTDLSIETWSGAVNIFAEALINKMMRCAESGRGCLDSPFAQPPLAFANSEDRTRIFLFNRKRRGITNAYMEWLCEDVDIDSIQKCPMELLDGLRGIQRLKSSREGTRQEFISHTEVSNGTPCLCVSLVMFKGNQPLRTQRVKLDELSRMGWIRDTHALFLAIFFTRGGYPRGTRDQDGGVQG